MNERLSVAIQWWTHRGWMLMVHYDDEANGRRIHWCSDGEWWAISDRAELAAQVLYSFSDWGWPHAEALLEDLGTWTIDNESAVAAAAARVGLE